MKNEINYCYYLVAFVDILGQKELFQTLNGIVPVDNDIRLVGVHKQTVEFVENLRKGFEDFFNAYTEEKESTQKVPESKKEQFDEMRKSKLKHQRFSDCIQAFVPLQSEKYHSNAINGVFGVLMACGGMLLLSLAMKKVFRAGIEIGIGTELSNGEIYGPALFKAHELESKIAKYPRIVIGNELINYLITLSNKTKQFPNQTPEDIELCKRVADNCLKMIVKDLDGYPILDYLGNKFRENIDNYPDQEEKISYKEIFEKAFQFIEEEYNKRKEMRDSKLALRYYLLYNYFKARVPPLNNTNI